MSLTAKTPRDDTKINEEGVRAVHGYDDDGNQFEIHHLNTECLPKFYHDAPKIKYTSRNMATTEESSREGKYKKKIVQKELKSVNSGLSDFSVDKPIKSMLDSALTNMEEDSSFNIRKNMRASYGIIYKEDTHREVGPDYMEFQKLENKKEENPPIKYSIKDYQEKFSMGNTLKQRAFEIHRKRLNTSNMTGDSEKSTDRSKAIAVRKTNTGGVGPFAERKFSQKNVVGQLGLLPVPSQRSSFHQRNKSVAKHSTFNDSKMSQAFDRSQIQVLTQDGKKELIVKKKTFSLNYFSPKSSKGQIKQYSSKPMTPALSNV